MYRIFHYLDKFFTGSKNKNTLSQNAMILYKEYFFNKLEKGIYREVNKLIKEDRNCYIESRPKIKTILKILYDLDLSNPKIMNENNKISWVQEGQASNNETKYQDKWYEDYFKFDTIKFAKDKGNADIHSRGILE